MTQNQRIALVTTLTGMALVLNALFFEWTTLDPDFHGNFYGRIFNSLACDSDSRDCLRIWYDSEMSQNSLLSVLFGIVLPLLMLSGAGYMWLGADPSKKLAADQPANERDDKAER